MTRTLGMVGNLAASRWLRNAWRRRAIAAALIVIFAIIALFPQKYRAATTMSPTDPASFGLGSALGQTSAFNSIFGNQAAIEIGLKVARSQQVRQIVAQKLDLVRTRDFADSITADRWLTSHVELRALRGGLLQIETSNTDAKFAISVVGAYSEALRQRLGEIARTQAAYKRQVLEDLIRRADDRLNKARSAYDAFRRKTRYTQPSAALAGIGTRVPSLRTTLKNKEVELQITRSFATDENIAVRQIKAEMQALRQQLREAESLDANEAYSVNRVVVESTKVRELELELAIAQNQYDNYKLFLEGVSVEELTSTGNLRILEPPYIDTGRQFRTLPAALALITLLLAIAMELYLLRPPVAAVRARTLEEA